MENNLRKLQWLDRIIEKLKNEIGWKEDEPVKEEKNLENYLHPIEMKLRNRYLEIVQKHGNGLWALEELVWEVYDKHIDEYEALSNEDKYILNMYMRVLRSLYK